MHNNQPNVSIILLNYNGYKDTIECLESLSDINYYNYNIIVVDNKSSDDSIKYIEQYIKNKKNIKFIKSEINKGFSAGNNIGIKYALNNNADYICLLNNDTIVENDFLIELVNIMEKDKNIAISSGKIMYYDNPEKIWFAGGFIDYKKTIGLHYGINQDDRDEFNKCRQVDFVTGCLQLIRSDIFEEIGLYDEEYFLYMEDVDFSYRTIKAGYILKYVPKSKIYHKVSSSTGGSESNVVIYYMNRNRLLFNKKNRDNSINKYILYIYYLAKIIFYSINDRNKLRYIIKAVQDYKNNKFGKAYI